MRIVRNLIKYTLGLPILLSMTLVMVVGGLVAFIIGDTIVESFLNIIIETWKPIK